MDFDSLLSSFKKSISQHPYKDFVRVDNPSGSAINNRKNKRGKSDDDSIAHRGYGCSNIYIVCPAYVETGGPEALHQLCDMINSVISSSGLFSTSSGSSLGVVRNCFMLYLEENSKTSSLSWASSIQGCYSSSYREAYTHIRIATEEPHRPTDLILWPECWTKYIDMYNSGQCCQTAIWWLSVDNNKKQFQSFDTRRDILHLYQSEYAHDYLRSKFNNTNSNTKELAAAIYKMTEYIPSHRYPPSVSVQQPVVLQVPDDEKNTKQQNDRPYDVVYNPLKGMHYTDLIIQYFLQRKQTNITFTPIAAAAATNTKSRRLTPTEVTKMLLKAKVYIDFGPHPGMDRLPREAALCGCCVITNRQGAAAFHKDIPIPSKFKIDVNNNNNNIDASSFLDQTYTIIKECVNSYDTMYREFDDYRQWISKQKDEMKQCVETFLLDINSDHIATNGSIEEKRVRVKKEDNTEIAVKK